MIPAQNVSLFEAIQRDLTNPLPQFQATKATLVHLSHSMEDLILQHDIPAMLFTGFQKSSYWAQETARYRKLAQVAKQVTIFAGQPLPEAKDIDATQVTLKPGDPLRQEWFVAVLSDKFSAVLCGLDAGIEAEEEADRVFETIWTMVPAQVNAVLDALEQIMAGSVPDKLAELQAARARFTPLNYNPTLVTYFVRDLLSFEERLNLGLRQAERDLRKSNATLEEAVKKRTQQLRHANRELRRMSQLKDEFVANISHALRTPVTSIKLYHHLMSKSPESTARYLATLEREVKRLEALIDDLLFISRMEHLDSGTDYNLVDLNTLVRQFAIDRQALAQDNGLTLTAEADPQMVTVIGDQMMLARMISAILTNALTYTPEGGTVSMSTSISNTWAELRVSDTGPGISAEERQRVFDRFYRGSASQIRKITGTGLGLAIAQEIATEHGGKITIESNEQQGTTFVVRLPYRPVN
jgi:signal transduction histidine kinase